jgi:hypothetical protein
LQVGDTGPVESARRSNSRVLGSPFSGLSGQCPWDEYEQPAPEAVHPPAVNSVLTAVSL